MPEEVELSGSQPVRPGSQVIMNTNLPCACNTRPQKSYKFKNVADQNCNNDFKLAIEDCDGSEANESSKKSQQVSIDQNPSQAIEANDN